MKKLIVLSLAIVLAFFITACDGSKTDGLKGTWEKPEDHYC